MHADVSEIETIGKTVVHALEASVKRNLGDGLLLSSVYAIEGRGCPICGAYPIEKCLHNN